MAPEAPQGEHLTERSLAAYVERSLPSEEQDRIEGHLADCPQCRTLLLAASATLRGEKKRKTVRVATGGAIGIGIVVGVALFTSLQPGAEVLRTRNEDTNLPGASWTLRAISPPEGGTVTGDSVLFTWSSLQPVARYRVTVTDPDSRVVWDGDVNDTVLFVPRSLLTPGETYLWYVDALLPDGTSATTGLRRFSVQR